jgi:hypothetical protein
LPIPPPRTSPTPDLRPSRSHLSSAGFLNPNSSNPSCSSGGVSHLLHRLIQLLEASIFRICGGEVLDLGDVKWFRSKLIPRRV